MNKPTVKKNPWIALVWALPLLVAVGVGYYLVDFMQRRGSEITIEFNDAMGLTVGETKLLYRGAEVGRVSGIELSDDRKHALVKARLLGNSDAFSSAGATFWVVRPEISQGVFRGFDTLLTGPYIQAVPGKGERAKDAFRGLSREPSRNEEGRRYVLFTKKLGHVQEGSAVTYKGIIVGEVDGIELARDATHVDVKIRVWKRYEPLVRENSKFWVNSGFDFKGGLFSGVEVQLDSLRTIASGGIAFATPPKDSGGEAKNGRRFAMESEMKKEWEEWSPSLPVKPQEGDAEKKAGT